MNNRFLISAAAIALIASAGFANAQGTGMSREQGGAAAQQSAPSTGNSAAPSNRNAVEPSGSSSGMKSTQSEEKSPAGAAKSKGAEENAPGQKSKGMSSENETKGTKDMKGGKDMKAEGREGRDRDQNAQSREGRDRDQNVQNREGRDRDQNAQTRERNDNMNAQTKSQTTTGQAGAGAKLSTEQRTKITTVIRNERVAPVNTVNFSIAVGTRVPREGVSFHPLPAEVVTIYPEWRGYEFIRVRDQIVVVDPATYEIVAILDV
jgi:Protein of unknown function (DUF1236)